MRLLVPSPCCVASTFCSTHRIDPAENLPLGDFLVRPP